MFFSLAKTMWMLLFVNNKGFDGVYNYLDESLSLKNIEKYKDIHLVEIHELLKDSINNNPELCPNIKEFKDKLTLWKETYEDHIKAEESTWKFLIKQLFGSTIPESSIPETSIWRDTKKIVEILNVVGMYNGYNHMMLTSGGLDFEKAELAGEDGCINIYSILLYCCKTKMFTL